jgi:putative methyltransferase (TIGR04325 family)
MKKIIKELIPPVIWKIMRRLTTEMITTEQTIPNSHQVFLNYQDALKLCTTDAYEERELIEVIFKKTKRFSESLKSEIIAISETAAYSLLSAVNPIIESKTNKINVLDFGGACGAHYFHLRSLIDKDLKLNWVVVETPTMVKYAKELESDELSFFDNFTDAINKLGKVGLLHTSGTLQCVDNPQKYLAEILKCNAKWLLFNRLGLNKLDRDVVTIHSSKLSWNGIGELPEGYTDRWVKYPFNFPSETTFLKTLEEKYLLVAKFNDHSGMYAVNGEDIVGYGLLCRLKTCP